MIKLLFETNNEGEAHRVLEYVLGHRTKEQNKGDEKKKIQVGVDPDWPGAEKFEKFANKHPKASCRVAATDNKTKPYSVWTSAEWERDEDFEEQQAAAKERVFRKGLKVGQSVEDRLAELKDLVSKLAETVVRKQ